MTAFDYAGVMWAEATRDGDAEARQELLLRGKLATAAFWPFLAAAESVAEFGHRLALVEARVAAVVPEPVLEPVLASVASDWKALNDSRKEASAQVEQGRLRQTEAHRAAQPRQVQSNDEIFDVAQGRWVRVSYIDPSDAQRYSHYPDMNPPVDNGPLQGPDGFVTGGEGDAGRSDAVIQQRQLTPGQWTVTPGAEWRDSSLPNAATGLPQGQQATGGRRQAVSRETLEDIERRDPDAGERQPTQADYDAHRAWAVGKHGPEAWERYRQGGWGLPDSHASRGQVSPSAADPTQVPRTAARQVIGGVDVTDWSEPEKQRLLQGMASFDKMTGGSMPTGRHDEWLATVRTASQLPRSLQIILATRSPLWEYEQLVRAYPQLQAFAGEGIVPTPGPNPNYFSQGAEGIAGPPSFPENPSSAIEPKTDNRMDNLYGAVPPQVSSGSAEGLVDGQGYSRQVPGSSATAAMTPTVDLGKVGGGKCANCGVSVSRNPNDGSYTDHRGRRQGGDGHWHKPTTTAGRRPFAERTAGGFDDGHVHRYVTWAQEQGHDPDEVSTLKKYQKEPGVGRAHVDHIADQLYIGGGDSDWRKWGSKQAATDGRIVGHCDNCNHPVRYHTGENGVDELRHLHNNHNRCSTGQKAASLRRSTAFFDPRDASVRVLADGMSRTRPTLDNPSGAGDEYDANTWGNAVTQRPMQSAEDRGINTPTAPREPIGTVSSEPGRADDDNRNQNGMARETALAGRSIEDLMEV